MSDKINVATCPACRKATKLSFPFIYTNTNQLFAVWWEPEFDAQIGRDSEAYVQMMGPENYLATAPRVKDWGEFKNTILKFERGELKAKAGTFSKEMKDKIQGFTKHLQDTNKKNNNGCFGIVLPLIVSTVVLTLIKKFLN
jgi:hypothetical protein